MSRWCRGSAIPSLRSWLCRSALFLLVPAAIGCAVGPEYVRPPVALNSEWNQSNDSLVTTQARADSAWWKELGDPTLDTLIAMSWNQNLPLQVTALRIYESRAQLGIAKGRQWPQIQAAFANATGVGLSEKAANSFFLDRQYWDFQAGFDAAWELDLWRKYGRGVSAEEASLLASVADYDDALVSITAEVARTYSVIRTYEALIDQARANVVVQEDGQRIARSRFRNGATSELDLSQATTLLESTRASIPQLLIGLQQAENALSTLLGKPVGFVRPLIATGAERGIPAPPTQAVISVPAEMLRRRPDIRSAEFTAMAQSERIGIARADMYPSFSLFGTIGTQATEGGRIGSAADLFSPGSWFYAFGPRLVWPLFNYGRIQNNVRVQDARLQQLLVDYQNKVLSAAQEVEDAVAGYAQSRDAVTFQQNAATSAERSVRLAFVQYREGATDFQRVLDAERALLQQQTSLTQLQSDVATYWIAMYKALGGGWELRRGQPIVPQTMQEEMRNRTNWGDYFSKQSSPPPSNDR